MIEVSTENKKLHWQPRQRCFGTRVGEEIRFPWHCAVCLFMCSVTSFLRIRAGDWNL